MLRETFNRTIQINPFFGKKLFAISQTKFYKKPGKWSLKFWGRLTFTAIKIKTDVNELWDVRLQRLIHLRICFKSARNLTFTSWTARFYFFFFKCFLVALRFLKIFQFLFLFLSQSIFLNPYQLINIFIYTFSHIYRRALINSIIWHLIRPLNDARERTAKMLNLYTVFLIFFFFCWFVLREKLFFESRLLVREL